MTAGEGSDTAEITLEWNDRLREFVESRSGREGFVSASDSIPALIREEKKRKAKAVILEKLLETIETGPAEPTTREDWDSIKREAIERLEVRKRFHAPLDSE